MSKPIDERFELHDIDANRVKLLLLVLFGVVLVGAYFFHFTVVWPN